MGMKTIFRKKLIMQAIRHQFPKSKKPLLLEGPFHIKNINYFLWTSSGKLL